MSTYKPLTTAFGQAHSSEKTTE